MPFVHLAHSEEAVRSWIRDRLVPTHRTLVAVHCETVVAMMAYSGDGEFFWIDQLYVDPAHARHGMGTLLLERGIALAAGRPIRLYTFQENQPARRFYERHGFRAIAWGDGSRNEERCPDALYERPAG